MQKLLNLIGPGLVFAATSIGVSHVVQSTRAGAEFGYGLIALIIAVHLIKLPFFQMGPRYAAATNESLLDAYYRQGKWAYGISVLVTFTTMFIIQAAVTIVAAGLIANIIPIGWSVDVWAAILMLSIVGLLVTGGYRILNQLIRWMMLLFAITCLITLVGILLADLPKPAVVEVNYTSAASIAFMVALAGWMPTAIEVSVWHSFWVVEQQKSELAAGNKESNTQDAVTNNVKKRILDFNIGYVLCCVFAVIFVIFGAQLLFGQGQTLSAGAIGFSAQLIGIFTSVLGDWSQPVVSVLIFIAMYSTCLAVADGFSQVLTRVAEKQFAQRKLNHQRTYHLAIPLICFGGWIVIYQFAGQLKSLVDFATTIAFISAPIFAWLNMRAMTLPNVPTSLRITGWYHLYTWCCLLLLVGFAIFFILWAL